MRGARTPAIAHDIRGVMRDLALELELPAAVLDAALEETRARTRAAAADEPREALRAAVSMVARAACTADDHRSEARVIRWRIDSEIDLDAGARAAAWHELLAALTHLADEAPNDARPAALAVLREQALDATADLIVRSDDETTDDAARRLLDPVARALLAAEEALGLGPSPLAAELAERHRVRATRTADSPTFAARHAEDLGRMRAQEARDWFLDRFVDRHGVDPPEGWWVDASESSPAAISPETAGLFEPEDHVDFLDETEARFRAERSLPARGEGWVSAASLTRCVQDALPGVEIVREARLPWLGAQRLDAFVPSLDLAIEYQGEQHYLPLEHWGGDAGLAARRELDERKRDACARAGVRLIEWRYDAPISSERVRRRLQDAGAIPLE